MFIIELIKKPCSLAVKDPALWRLGPRFESWRGYDFESSKLMVESRKADDQNLTKNNYVSFEDLSQDKLKNLISTLSEIRKKKYKRRKGNKYGSLNKGFTDEELNIFFKFCSNPKARLCFILMSQLGLRIGEVVKITLFDLNFKENRIRIFTEKSKTIDFLHLHEKVRIPLKSWVQLHEKAIEKSEGYLFFSDNPERKYISKDWLRKEFREVCKRAGLDETYGVAEDINNPLQQKRGIRKLHRLSTHSLRHHFITKVYDSCKDPIKTQMLARHCDFKSTQVYIHTNQKEVDETLEKVFEQDNGEKLDKSDLRALLELAKMLKEKN